MSLLSELPVKAVTVLLKAVYRHCVVRDVTLSVEELRDSVFTPALPSAASNISGVVETVLVVQRLLAAGASGHFSAADMQTHVDKLRPALPGAHKDAIVAFWRDTSAAIHAHVAAHVGTAGSNTLQDFTWRVRTQTAASANNGGTAADGSEAVLHAQFNVLSPSGDASVLDVSVSKEVMLEAVKAVEAAARAAELVSAS